MDTFVSIKLKEEDPLTIGYITKKNHILSDLGKLFVSELGKYKTYISEWLVKRTPLFLEIKK